MSQTLTTRTTAAHIQRLTVIQHIHINNNYRIQGYTLSLTHWTSWCLEGTTTHRRSSGPV